MRPRYEDHPEHFRIIREAVLRAADPYEAVRAACARRAEREPGLRHAGFVSIGKAAVRMREGMRAVVGEGVRGVTVAPEGTGGGADVIIGDHPLPTGRSVAAGEAVRAFVGSCAAKERRRGGEGAEDGAVLTLLLSGGASALVCLPVDGVTLDDLRAVTSTLLRAGATIAELNAVRKHVEQLKGGRMARLAFPCRVDAFILSDVIGDDLDVIGSGPVTPDLTTFSDARTVLEQHRATETGPTLTAALTVGDDPDEAETPKPGDPVFERVRVRVIGSNATALSAARGAVEGLGFRVAEVRRGVVDDAADAGMTVAALVKRPPAMERPLAVLLGGETTVAVGDAPGRGGRNQELMVAAAIGLDGSERIAAMAFATDGVDGPTDAAGAVVTSETCAGARALGLDPLDTLEEHDSYGLLDGLGCLIRTGPTGTNVNDIVVALAY